MNDLPHVKQLSEAVETRAAYENISTRRMRRWIAVIALVQVFYAARSRNIFKAFAIKGGHALEIRLRAGARASRDVDMVIEPNQQELADVISSALREAWSGFSFSIRTGPEHRDHSIRFEISARYKDRDWSTFELEVVEGEVTEEDFVDPLDLQGFGLPRAESIPCINMSVQIAQKLHALTDPTEDRSRDLFDLYIIDAAFDCNDAEICEAIDNVFRDRKTHTWPAPIELREGWAEQLASAAEKNGLDVSPDEVLRGVRGFVLRLIGERSTG